MRDWSWCLFCASKTARYHWCTSLFRLATTSFIYRADYVTNVRRLAPFVDEIELLLFESHKSSLPSKAVVAELAQMADEHDITYNVHLPLDVYMGAVEAADRYKTVQSLSTVLDRVRPLSPTTHTLHLNYTESDQKPATIKAWQERTMDSVAQLLHTTDVPSQAISVETLDFAPQWLESIVARFDLGVCVDVGHVIRYGFNLQKVFKAFSQRIQILHLHGVNNGSDHLSLAHLGPDARQVVVPFLSNFNGSVSLELFSFQPLQDSLECLADMMDR